MLDTNYWYICQEGHIIAARNTSVSLGEHFTEFIDKEVASGRYDSASDVVRAGLHKLEAGEEKLEWLRARIAEGLQDIEQGRFYEESDDFRDKINQEVDERIAREQKARADAVA